MGKQGRTQKLKQGQKPKGYSQLSRSGLNWYQLKQLKGRVLFLQDFKCIGCGFKINGEKFRSEIHHKDGNPKNNAEWNLEILHDDCHTKLYSGSLPRPTLERWFFDQILDNRRRSKR